MILQIKKQRPFKKVMADECSRLYEQLVIIFFGHRCAECEETGGILQYSAVPVCHSVDGVLSHMKYCQAGMSCRFPGCSFARVIVSHWKICRKNECPVILNLSEDRKKKIQVMEKHCGKPSLKTVITTTQVQLNTVLSGV
ncbi:unnamed protein product [Ranitomeya imitator]|uniref:histone acetyltransferase n=1 Tax=Ranitomeya imitator TaxID=111125 RepID=A0ABN9L661_9NEOB|nr:unnamed protein product [Ranitomeya imitator]